MEDVTRALILLALWARRDWMIPVILALPEWMILHTISGQNAVATNLGEQSLHPFLLNRVRTTLEQGIFDLLLAVLV